MDAWQIDRQPFYCWFWNIFSDFFFFFDISSRTIIKEISMQHEFEFLQQICLLDRWIRAETPEPSWDQVKNAQARVSNIRVVPHI